ncbi:hypothetical protein HDA40_002154 [Hamadaea flava]|uniref:CHAT domain-containing protein n=1 Tax=Hamadaea flava TaxID=1742688 RepID=A0ABV8LLL2_9ACTN|nr:hypothetical protein [Hamadaea flava]MCP2323647.1 hypothetical protein [Hamadaea flava]
MDLTVEPGADRTTHLIAERAASRVVRHLRHAGDTAAAAGRLRVRLEDGPEHERILAAQAPVDLVVLDGHGYPDDRRVGRMRLSSLRSHTGGIEAPAVMLGYCWGAEPPLIDALAECLCGPTAVLACAGSAPYERGEILLTELLLRLARCDGPIVADSMYTIMSATVDAARAQHARRHWQRWRALLLPRHL